MKNINRKNQLFFDFGRDYEANLDNFFFSSKNKLLKSELNNFINGETGQNIFITARNGDGKTFLLNSILNHDRLKKFQVIYIDVALLTETKNYFDEILRTTIYDITQLKAKKIKKISIDRSVVNNMSTPKYQFEDLN